MGVIEGCVYIDRMLPLWGCAVSSEGCVNNQTTSTYIATSMVSFLTTTQPVFWRGHRILLFCKVCSGIRGLMDWVKVPESR